jgi:flagellar biosynthesis protein FlhF
MSMSVKKYTAATTRDALRMVREELGDEAVILSNKKVGSGIEIMAMSNAELTDMTQSNKSSDAFQARFSDIPQLNVKADVPAKGLAKTQAGAMSGVKKPAMAVPPETTIRQPRRIIKQETLMTQSHKLSASVEPDIAALASMQSAPSLSPEQLGLEKELKSMRNLLQEQFACMAWSDMQQRDPKRTRLLRNLVNAGFSPGLARQMLEKMPPEADMAWVHQVLNHNLHVATDAEDVVMRGGVYALTGPTGVGKTTTTAKLAARAVVRYGADSVALITTDAYRIGALEQLRIYGKILGVTVHAARDTGDLGVTLSGLKHKRLVLIDTMGMGQRDKRVKDQADMFDALGVQRLLLLNATSCGDTLEEVVRRYHGNGVIGCIATKLDEAVTLGAVLDVMMRHKLSLHFVANGQRVPEDLHEVNMAYLLHRAFESATKPAAFAAQELDIPALMAGQDSHTLARNTATQGRGYAI